MKHTFTAWSDVGKNMFEDRYQGGGNQNPLITDGYNTKYKGQSGKQRSTKHYTENITQKTLHRKLRIVQHES